MLVNTLIYWYSNLHCAVLWTFVLGENFSAKCGVRQGGVLSPYFISLYADDVINDVRKSGYMLVMFLQVVFCMRTILFYSLVATVVCSKWLIFVQNI